MELYNGKYCISHSELTDGIVSEFLIKKWNRDGKVDRVRRGCNNTPALYAVDSLPYKYKIEVYRRDPDLKAQADSQEFIDEIIPDGVAADFYERYRFDGVRGLSERHQTEYLNGASILKAFRTMIERANARRSSVSKPQLNKGEFWQRAKVALPRIADKYPHSLPESARRLQAKYNEFFAGGTTNYEVLISKKFQNSNAASIVTEEQEAVVVSLLGDHRNLDNRQVADIYNIVAEKMGWKTITPSAMKSWREKKGFETSAGRLGSSEFYNKMAMQVKRTPPKLPLYMWSLDGWDVELYYQKTEERGGRSVTTFHNRLTVVVVLDPCISYPIGYAIGEAENPDLITAALRNAANHTAQLFGSRYRVNQIQSDRYAIKKMTPFYEMSGDKSTPARAGNAKSKPVERYFGKLNKTYCQLMMNWSGFGITSKKELQPNSDALNALRHSFPDMEGCKAQIIAIMERERAKHHDKYIGLWGEVEDKYRIPMSEEQYLLTFGSQNSYKNTLEGDGLRVRIEGAKRVYDCFDPKFREYRHVRWNIKFDPDNLDRVLAVNDDSSLKFMLESKYVQPMALVERTEEDTKELSRVREFNTVIEKEIKDRVAISGRRVEQLFAHNPQLDNTLARAVICDSLGQHKNRRNERRLAAVDVESIEVKTVDEAEEIVVPQTTNKDNHFKLY